MSHTTFDWSKPLLKWSKPQLQTYLTEYIVNKTGNKQPELIERVKSVYALVKLCNCVDMHALPIETNHLSSRGVLFCLLEHVDLHRWAWHNIARPADRTENTYKTIQTEKRR